MMLTAFFTVCGIAALFGAYWCGSEIAARAAEQMDDNETSVFEHIRNARDNLWMFAIASAGIVTSLHSLYSAWF